MSDDGALDDVIEMRCSTCKEEFVAVSINDVGIRFYDQASLTAHMKSHQPAVDKT
jgi:hypothetical protein